MQLSEYQQRLYNEWVNYCSVFRAGEKTTIAVLILKNGFEVVGTSACVDPKDFVFSLGYHYAVVDALKKLDELVGFQRQVELNKKVN
jgi:hypothetical protein